MAVKRNIAGVLALMILLSGIVADSFAQQGAAPSYRRYYPQDNDSTYVPPKNQGDTSADAKNPKQKASPGGQTAPARQPGYPPTQQRPKTTPKYYKDQMSTSPMETEHMDYLLFAPD